MNGHRFGWSGRYGVDRCACGTERTLLETLTGPRWLFRLGTVTSGLEVLWPCAKAAA